MTFSNKRTLKVLVIYLLLAVILTAFVISRIPKTGSSPSYCDVPMNSWFYPYLQKLSINSPLRQRETPYCMGNSFSSEFGVSQTVTRREAVVLLTELLKTNSPTLSNTVHILDWNEDLAVRTGLIVGQEYKGNHFFYPEANLTRGQMAVLLSRLLQSKLVQKPPLNFSNNSQVLFPADITQGHPFYLSIKLLYDYGLVRGYPVSFANGWLFKPDQLIRKDEFTKLYLEARDILNN